MILDRLVAVRPLGAVRLVAAWILLTSLGVGAVAAAGEPAARAAAREGGPWTAREGGPWTAREGGPWTAREGGPWPAAEGGPWARAARRVLPESWDLRLGDWASPGALAAAHDELRGITRCATCHTSLSGTADADCLACHEKVGRRMEAAQGVHDAFTGACGDCHVEHRGADHDLSGLDRDAFNHDRALFVLRGAHAELECEACHLRTEQEGAKTEQAGPGTEQDGPGEGRSEGGSEGPAEERFVTIGIAHADCVDCHRDPHGGAWLRERACGDCHAATATSWSVAGLREPEPSEGGAAQEVGFDHDRDTRFALDAAHASVACDACHEPLGTGVADPDRPGGEVAEVDRPLPPRECAACHEDARALLDGRFAGRRARPDPHHELACRKCHPARTASAADLVELGRACMECHPDAYASLLLDQRRVLDEALVAAEGRLRRAELAARRGEAARVDPAEAARWRRQLERLSSSGLHHPELAEALVRALVSP